MAATVVPRRSHANVKMASQTSVGHKYAGFLGQREHSGRDETILMAADGSHD